MSGKLLPRVGAAAFVGVVAAVTIAGFVEDPAPPRAPAVQIAAAETDKLSARLKSCAAMGEAALYSPDCRAAWAEKRERFFGVAHPSAYATFGEAPASKGD